MATSEAQLIEDALADLGGRGHAITEPLKELVGLWAAAVIDAKRIREAVNDLDPTHPEWQRLSMRAEKQARLASSLAVKCGLSDSARRQDERRSGSTRPDGDPGRNLMDLITLKFYEARPEEEDFILEASKRGLWSEDIRLILDRSRSDGIPPEEVEAMVLGSR